MDAIEASRVLQPARDEFLVRFYRWSCLESLHEFESNFPLVGDIKNSNISRFFAFLRSLSSTDEHLFRSVLLKKFHPRAVEILKDPPSAGELMFWNQYRGFTLEPLPPNAAEGRGNRANVRKLLLRKLTPALGEPLGLTSNRKVWHYETEIGCWTVETEIDIGGRSDLTYLQTVRAQGSVALVPHISIMSWMGLGQTCWQSLREDEHERAVDTLKACVLKFVSSAPTLLDGLSHSVPELPVDGWSQVVTVQANRRNGMTRVLADTSEGWQLPLAFHQKMCFDLPTSIIPEDMRAEGTKFVVLQDPTFIRGGGQDLATKSLFRHIRVRSLFDSPRESGD
jgi:hypothetical protein